MNKEINDINMVSILKELNQLINLWLEEARYSAVAAEARKANSCADELKEIIARYE